MTTTPSLDQLKRAIQITEQIERLQSELNQIFGSSSGKTAASKAPAPKATKKKRRGGISAAGRAAIAAAQKARWAKLKSAKIEPKPARKRRKLSAEARAKISAAAKKMWAARNAGK